MPKQKSNTLPLPQRLIEDAKTFALQAFQRLFGLAQGWEKHRDIVQNNYELGCRHLDLGNLRDAILRLKMVTWLDPKHADGWYRLGCAYVADGKPGLAKTALKRSLQLRPGNDEAIYMLAMAGGNVSADVMPKKMPLTLAERHFDHIAPNFAQEQLNTYHYQGHILLADVIRGALTPGRMDHVILELGVGTGLCGSRLRDVASQLTGVDISAAMLDQAVTLQDESGKKIYDALIKREASEFLRDAAPAAYDIVLASGMFSYVGDLSDIYTQAARVLKPGGMFAFTADKMEGEGFRLDSALGRFLFSRAYLEALAVANDFKTVKLSEAPIYQDYDGWLCVFIKK